MEKTTEKEFPYAKDNKERLPWEHYLSLYGQADPQEIAQRLGISYDEGTKSFAVGLLGSVYKITWPDFQVDHEPDEIGYYPLEDMIAAKILVIMEYWHLRIILCTVNQSTLCTSFIIKYRKSGVFDFILAKRILLGNDNAHGLWILGMGKSLCCLLRDFSIGIIKGKVIRADFIHFFIQLI